MILNSEACSFISMVFCKYTYRECLILPLKSLQPDSSLGNHVSHTPYHFPPKTKQLGPEWLPLGINKLLSSTDVSYLVSA